MRATPIDNHFADLVGQKKIQAFVIKKVITSALNFFFRPTRSANILEYYQFFCVSPQNQF